MNINSNQSLKTFGIKEWMLSVEAEANRQHEQRELAESAYRRGLRQTLWSIPALALITYMNFGFQDPAPWTEQEIFEGTNSETAKTERPNKCRHAAQLA